MKWRCQAWINAHKTSRHKWLLNDSLGDKGKPGVGGLCYPGGRGSDGRLLEGTLRIPGKLSHLEFYSGSSKIMAKSKYKGANRLNFWTKKGRQEKRQRKKNATFFMVEARNWSEWDRMEQNLSDNRPTKNFIVTDTLLLFKRSVLGDIFAYVSFLFAL